MTRFNEATKPVTVKNLAGGTAFPQDARLELASIVLTSFVQDKFYRTADTEITKVRELVAADPLFAAKAAIYGRLEHGMRSISHVIAAEVCEQVKGEAWVKRFIQAVVRRPDDMTEIVACRAQDYGLHPFPNSLKKGLAAAFLKFDSYSLAKYRAEGKAVSLVDVVNLVHPRPAVGTKSEEAIAALVGGTLRNTETWEAKVSAAGTSEAPEAKQQAWSEMIRSGQLGYMALLRNLRNIAQEVDDQDFGVALVLLTNEHAIRKSLVLPFRYASAYKEIAEADIPERRRPLLLGTISNACDIACQNVPELPGTTLIALDVSGSMGQTVSDKSGMKLAQIGGLFAAALIKRNPGNAWLLTFDTARQVVAIDPNDSALGIAARIPYTGGGTNMDLVFEINEPVDRFIILSDMQAWVNGHWSGGNAFYYGREGQLAHKPSNDALKRYRERSGGDPVVHAMDLAGYGSMQFPAAKCFQYAGWSEKIFDIMPLVESDRDALVKTIERYPAAQV